MWRRLRHLVVGALVAGAVIASLAMSASAAGDSKDVQLAKTGVLVPTDFPAGWTSEKATGLSDAAIIKLASPISSCSKYVALKKLTHATPKANSPEFSDQSRQISNEVDVFSSPAKAGAAVTLYGSKSVATCLERVFTKVFTQQLAKEPNTKGKVKSVMVTLEAQSIAALGEQNVVYEGNVQVSLKDGTTEQIGLGNAAVRVGRVVDDFTYQTTDAPLTDVLGTLVDASLARVQAASASSS
jgi:hypothetical protein